MLLNITSIINAINSAWLLSIGFGFILSLINILLSTTIHEFSHWIVTLYYGKSLNYSCTIKLFSFSRNFKPHTESDYYTYLELNRSNIEIQKIIRHISIAGYLSSFLYLFLILSLFVFFAFKLQCFLFATLFTIVVFGFDVCGYLKSTDRENYKKPQSFTYKYK